MEKIRQFVSKNAPILLENKIARVLDFVVGTSFPVITIPIVHFFIRMSWLLKETAVWDL